MFFFVGWPKVIPIHSSEVVDIQHNASKKWTIMLTKDRISVWNFFLNQNILLGYYKRSDLIKYGENKFTLFYQDSNKIAVVVCTYIFKIQTIYRYSIIYKHINTDNKSKYLFI